MASNTPNISKAWRHSNIAYSYNNTPPQQQHYYHHRKYSKGKIVIQDAKDKELEVVMTAIHEFFNQNSGKQELYADGVSKTDLCNYVIQQIPELTISKFRFALNHAVSLRLVQINKETMKISIGDDFEEVAHPERITTWNDAEPDKNHQKKDLKCFFCKKLFYDNRGLRQHLLQTHYQAMGYRFKCTNNNCTYKFKTKRELTIHIESLHVE